MEFYSHATINIIRKQKSFYHQKEASFSFIIRSKDNRSTQSELSFNLSDVVASIRKYSLEAMFLVQTAIPDL